MLLGGYFLLLAVQSGFKRVPGQGGALHARRELRDAGEHFQLAHIRGFSFFVLPGHHAVKALEHLLGFRQRLSLEGLRHH